MVRFREQGIVNTHYRTQDFVTAAFLACCGFDADLQLVRPGRVEFFFVASPELDQNIRSYRRGEARVPPGAFHLCQIELRRQMDDVLR